MSLPAIIALILATVAAMEFVAWASHKYIMHGFGWAWHRDHHEPHDGVLEKNDLFALFGAAMSISAFASGSPMIMGARAWEPGTWIGLGVLFYGIIYTLVHDGLVHQRYFRWVPRRGYAKRTRASSDSVAASAARAQARPRSSSIVVASVIASPSSSASSSRSTRKRTRAARAARRRARSRSSATRTRASRR